MRPYDREHWTQGYIFTKVYWLVKQPRQGYKGTESVAKKKNEVKTTLSAYPQTN